MAPKKDQTKPKGEKAAVDKSFGMKNKKGGAAQKQIKQMQANASSSKTTEQKRKEAEKLQREKEKKAAEDARRETAELFKPVQTQKVPFGVDPKTVLCQFFKKGACEKGEDLGQAMLRRHDLTDWPSPKARNANSAMTSRSNGRVKRSHSIPILEKMSRMERMKRRRITWRTGMRRNCGV